ncbi:uncharacterized protein LOC124661973 [Lolium rigidum]|uniref:uncharacterized protein LOC124661973 n=1 Tax=Lolium rigidum TaxID=89674 RepID=UPI001F5D6B09|nr:uncharacterized protein LOC124661973 [Lolium rigidum]
MDAKDIFGLQKNSFPSPRTRSRGASPMASRAKYRHPVYALTGGVGIVLLMPTIEASHLKCRPAVEKVKLMALLLLRHTLTITSSDDEDDASSIFSLFLLREAGFLLP